MTDEDEGRILVEVRIVLDKYMSKFVYIYLCLLGNDNKGFVASGTDPGSSTVKRTDEPEEKDAKESEQDKKE